MTNRVRYIENIIEPTKLLLSWQPTRASNMPRMRRFVAELVSDDENVRLEYLTDTDDFKEAVKAGFSEYPGFKIQSRIHEDVLAAFMRRLLPRKRNDFDRFLTAIRIDPAVKDGLSNFALLGYSGAKLPGDGFSVINIFIGANPPFEIFTNIQGYRHYLGSVPYSEMIEDLVVTFEREPNNDQDPYAIIALIDDKKIGYVCRGLNKAFCDWLDAGLSISAVIERVNGTIENPKIYAFVKVCSNNSIK